MRAESMSSVERVECAICWDKNITYFKKLPRGSAMLEAGRTHELSK